MKEDDMNVIADFMERVLVEGEGVQSVRKDVEDFRLPSQTIYYCFDNGLPLR
jgi:glycine hydroxymethyltransferase